MGVTLAVVLGLGVAGNGLAADWVPDRYEAPPEFAQVAPVEPVNPPYVRGTPDRYEVTLEAGGGALDALIRVPPAPCRRTTGSNSQSRPTISPAPES